MKKTKNEPTIYKFEFYAHRCPWIDATETECIEQVEEVLMHLQGLQQMSKVEVTEYSLKAKPTTRKKS